MIRWPDVIKSAVGFVVVGAAVVGCGGDDALDDDAARDLVERVLADVQLPGVREPGIDRSQIPDGELEFGFHCQIRSAGFAIDDVLVAFPPPAVGHKEIPGGPIERAEVAILVFDTTDSAAAVAATYGEQDTLDCQRPLFSEALTVEADDPLEAAGVIADGFAITIGVGGIQPDGHRTFVVPVGRILVDVGVLAPDEQRGRELAEQVLGDVVDALQSGGA